MSKLKQKIYNKVGVKSSRTKNIVHHISLSVFYKVGSIIGNFLLVPLTISYLDTDNYGIWLTLSSFIAWFSFFDIGLGNGLRNKFSEAKTLGKHNLAKAYVSTSYFVIGGVSVLLFSLFFVLNFFIDWTTVFSVDTTLFNDLKLLMPVVFGFFCLQLVLKLITTIFIADQNHSLQGKIQFLTQLVSLIIIWLLTKTSQGSLLIFGTIISALPVLILLLLNIYGFTTVYKNYKPTFRLCKLVYLKDIMSLGVKFFVVQMAAIILFSTDNFIIIKLFGPEEVVPYNIAFKYFSIITMAYTIIVTPYWSSFTEAYVKKDFVWIKNSVKNILKIWLLIPVALIVMVLISTIFYEFWIGDAVKVSLNLSLSMALFVMLTTFNMVFVNFINGVGKIKLQLLTSIVSLIINIPLSIFLAKTMGLGVSGVILATCCSLGYSVILRPMQYYKIINNKATGIWNK